MQTQYQHNEQYHALLMLLWKITCKKNSRACETYIHGGYLAKLTRLLQRQQNIHFTVHPYLAGTLQRTYYGNRYLKHTK